MSASPQVPGMVPFADDQEVFDWLSDLTPASADADRLLLGRVLLGDLDTFPTDNWELRRWGAVVRNAQLGPAWVLAEGGQFLAGADFLTAYEVLGAVSVELVAPMADDPAIARAGLEVLGCPESWWGPDVQCPAAQVFYWPRAVEVVAELERAWLRSSRQQPQSRADAHAARVGRVWDAVMGTAHLPARRELAWAVHLLGSPLAQVWTQAVGVSLLRDGMNAAVEPSSVFPQHLLPAAQMLRQDPAAHPVVAWMLRSMEAAGVEASVDMVRWSVEVAAPHARLAEAVRLAVDASQHPHRIRAKTGSGQGRSSAGRQ